MTTTTPDLDERPPEIEPTTAPHAPDPPGLPRRIARTTGGTYHPAADAAALAKVYDSIQLEWVTRTVPHEITSLVAGLGALLVLAGASVSVLRHGRVI